MAILGKEEWSGVGGRILPEQSFTPPVWLTLHDRYALAPLAIFDLGTESRELFESPFGTNMAFHRSMFEKYGTFRIDLGPRPNSEIRDEDTEFGRRLLAAGERIKYEPRAVVHHEVPQKRLKREFFLKWWFDKGRGSVREAGVSAHREISISGIPLHLFRHGATGALRWMFSVDRAKRFSRKLNVWLLAGKIVESYQQSKKVTKRAYINAVLP